jgi:hypothetical protein
MSEPTSALSMLDLCTAIAKEAGIAYRGPNGTSISMLPINKHNLQDVKDIVNDGIQSFVSDAPPSGWLWRNRILQVPISGPAIEGTADDGDSTSLTDAILENTYDEDDDLNNYWVYIISGTGQGSFAQITDYTGSGGIITVAEWLTSNGNSGGTAPAADDEYIITKYETVAGDIGRYLLSEDFGGEINGRIEYVKNTSHTTEINWADESSVRKLRSVSETPTGYPYLATIRPIEPVSGLGPKRRYELLVYPDPVQDDILEFPYCVVFNKLDIESGITTSVTGASYILADSTRSEADDYFNGWKLSIIHGTGKGQLAIVDDYDSATGGFIFTEDTWFATEPDTTSVYVVEPVNNLHPAGIKFDKAIKSACLAKAEQYFTNINSGRTEEYIQKDLPQAWKADARSRLHIIIKAKKILKQVYFKPVEHS